MELSAVQRRLIFLLLRTITDSKGRRCFSSDILVNNETDLMSRDYKRVSCLLVDEAQFLPARIIDELREITLLKDIPVICYGLRTDFRTKLFEGSLRLMELADSIEEVKATCHFCNRKSIANLKHVNGVATLEGPSVQLGCEEKYFPACYRCFAEQHGRVKSGV
jgi:thymidine kinase